MLASRLVCSCPDLTHKLLCLILLSYSLLYMQAIMRPESELRTNISKHLG